MPALGTKTNTSSEEVHPRGPPIKELEEATSQQTLASSSSSPDKRVIVKSTSPPLHDYKACEKWLKRMAVVLDIQVKQVCEKLHRLVDILASAGPCRVGLPINEAILESIKVLWQTLFSIPPTTKTVKQRYYIPLRELSTYILIPLGGSLVVSMANERERERDRVTRHLHQRGKNQQSWTYLEGSFIPQEDYYLQLQTSRLCWVGTTLPHEIMFLNSRTGYQMS